MSIRNDAWAIVLAGGDGVRPCSLTIDSRGRSVPKQYSSLFGGPTLLQHALSRGTAMGILLSVLWTLSRDPAAKLLFLPADHYVEHEERLAVAIDVTMAELDLSPEHLVLLGVAPDEPDPELGYIACGDSATASRRVARFVEKPSRPVAAHLLAQGALWNSFIFAATGTTLLSLFRGCMPDIVDDMETAVARAAYDSPDSTALSRLYETLPERDFSRDVLAKYPEVLRVVPAPACGWSDLGTPPRMGKLVDCLGLAGTCDSKTHMPLPSRYAARERFVPARGDLHHCRHVGVGLDAWHAIYPRG
jgi:mannose-1-phosphate guanylyltransferase